MRTNLNAATRDESTTTCKHCFRDATVHAGDENNPLSNKTPLCATHAAQSNAEMEVLGR